jgi:putative ABC transport system permease protein
MKLYRLLLSLYPARFREEYAGPLQQQFLEDYREAHTVGERSKLWLSALRDLAWSIPVELAHELKQDLSHSLRVHARRPFVMTFTIAILALAIGGATGVFSVVNAVLIKSLPFRDPGRLVIFSGGGRMMASPAAFHKWRSDSRYLDDAAAYYTSEMTVSGASTPLRVIVAETSAGFFSALGSEPMLGRAFAPSEDVAGNDGVAVISHSLWQQFYGGDPRILGSKLVLSGVPMTIIGIAPPGLDYPSKASVWTPTFFDYDRLAKTGVIAMQMIGRMKSGLNFGQAEQIFEAESELYLHPSIVKLNPANRPRLIPLQEQLAKNIRQASLVLLAAIGFVLLIACANVANLLLTRTTERRGELVIRAALGASRARLVQQLLSESVLLSFTAAATGLAVAYWATKLAAYVQPAALAAQVYTILDWRVLGFAMGIAVLTGLLFGVVPAWMVRHLQPSGDLVRMHSSGPRTARLRSVLIAMQAALTLVLLAGSVTMGRSFLHLLGTDIGFRTDHLVTVSVSLAGIADRSESHHREYGRQVLDRLRSVPGVESAAAVDFLPLVEQMFMGAHLITETGRETSVVVFGKVTSDYFRTMGTEIVYGREFLPADAKADNYNAIVTEGLAREVADGSSVIGRKVAQKRFDGSGANTFTIVGVVRPVRYHGPEGPATEQIFFPADRYFPGFATFIARVHGDAADSLAVCRDAVQSVDREIPVFGVKTYQQRLDETLAVPRFRTTVFLFFGGFALLLAIAGIYGVSSYSITQRRREIGVRIAIGASAQGVRAMILRQALWPIGAGMLIGFAGAAWQGKLLEHLLSSAPSIDLSACAASAVLLAAVAILSIWSATSRVLELNPIEVLKAE